MTKNLTPALRELADAIDKLADLVEQQRSLDAVEPARQLSIIKERFKSITTSQDTVDSWKAKYKRGYLKNWLKNKSIIPAQATPSLKSNQYVAETAGYLAEHFEYLAEFYQRLKYGQSQRRNFTFRGKKDSLPYIRKWCTMLKSNRLIDASVDKENEVYVDIAELAEATGFINGYWLEIYLRAVISSLLKNNPGNVESFDVLSQVQLLKYDGKFTEFDLLLMLNNEVYWFECKSGDIGRYYQLFNDHRQMLQLGLGNAIAVIPEPNVHMLANFKNKSGMQCFDATALEEQLYYLFFNTQ